MVTASQRTVYNVALHLAMLFNKPYKILSNTTLNEKFEIEANSELADNVYPSLKYIGIGIGGSVLLDNTDAYTYSEHSPIQGALFEHIPYVLRKPNNDIDAGERSKYRFRKIVNIEGEPYIAYYLKLIDTFDLRDVFYNIKETVDGSILSLFDTNTVDILSPSPKNRDIAFDAPVEYVTKIANIKFSLSNEELLELNNVFKILKKDNVTITEMVLATGVDKTNVLGEIEATSVQAGFFINTNIDVVNQLKNKVSVAKVIEIGGLEPLRM